jgi:methylase of polypeptide subunit release factors
LLEAAGALEVHGSEYRSRVRFSTLQGSLFVHSAYPTLEPEAVFFGPDTYRFCSLLERWAPSARRVVDIGCGTGAGGLALAFRASEVVLADVNRIALDYAEVNAALAGVRATVLQSDVLGSVSGDFDLAIANPPYMVDAGGRAYRDGGGDHGEALSARIVREALLRLSRPGTLIVYTGAAIRDGVDQFYAAIEADLRAPGLTVRYEELDPDVFGEELEQSHYAHVERIAAVGLRVRLA